MEKIDLKNAFIVFNAYRRDDRIEKLYEMCPREYVMRFTFANCWTIVTFVDKDDLTRRDTVVDQDNGLVVVGSYDEEELMNACKFFPKYNLTKENAHSLISRLYADYGVEVFKKLSEYMHFCAVIIDPKNEKTICAGVTEPNNRYTSLYCNCSTKKEIHDLCHGCSCNDRAFSNNEYLLKMAAAGAYKYDLEVEQLPNNTYLFEISWYKSERPMSIYSCEKDPIILSKMAGVKENLSTYTSGKKFSEVNEKDSISPFVVIRKGDCNYEQVMKMLKEKCSRGYVVKTEELNGWVFAKVVKGANVDKEAPFIDSSKEIVSMCGDYKIKIHKIGVASYIESDLESVPEKLSKDFFMNKVSTDWPFYRKWYMPRYCAVFLYNNTDVLIGTVSKSVNENTSLYYGYTKEEEIIFSNDKGIVQTFCPNLTKVRDGSYVAIGDIYGKRRRHESEKLDDTFLVIPNDPKIKYYINKRLNEICSNDYVIKYNAVYNYIFITFDNKKDPKLIEPIIDYESNCYFISSYHEEELMRACEKFPEYKDPDKKVDPKLISRLYAKYGAGVFKILGEYMHFSAVIFDEGFEKLCAGVSKQIDGLAALYYYNYELNNTYLFSNNRELIKELAGEKSNEVCRVEDYKYCHANYFGRKLEYFGIGNSLTKELTERGESRYELRKPNNREVTDNSNYPIYVVFRKDSVDYESVIGLLNRKCPCGYRVKTLEKSGIVFAKMVEDKDYIYQEPFVDVDSRSIGVSGYVEEERKSADIKLDFFVRDFDSCKVWFRDFNYSSVILDDKDNYLVAVAAGANNNCSSLYYGMTEYGEYMYSNSEDVLKQFCVRVTKMEECTYIREKNSQNNRKIIEKITQSIPPQKPLTMDTDTNEESAIIRDEEGFEYGGSLFDTMGEPDGGGPVLKRTKF